MPPGVPSDWHWKFEHQTKLQPMAFVPLSPSKTFRSHSCELDEIGA